MQFNLKATNRQAKQMLRSRKTLAQALEEANRPETAQQQIIRARVEAKGMEYAVNGNGVGCVFKRK